MAIRFLKIIFYCYLFFCIHSFYHIINLIYIFIILLFLYYLYYYIILIYYFIIILNCLFLFCDKVNILSTDLREPEAFRHNVAVQLRSLLKPLGTIPL